MRGHGAARRGCARGIGLPLCPPAGRRQQGVAEGSGTRVCSLWACWWVRTLGSGAVVCLRRCDLGEGVCGSRRSRLRSVREAAALRLNSGIPSTGAGVFPHALAQVSISVLFPARGQPSIPPWQKSVLASLPFIPPHYETGHYSKL